MPIKTTTEFIRYPDLCIDQSIKSLFDARRRVDAGLKMAPLFFGFFRSAAHVASFPLLVKFIE